MRATGAFWFAPSRPATNARRPRRNRLRGHTASRAQKEAPARAPLPQALQLHSVAIARIDRHVAAVRLRPVAAVAVIVIAAPAPLALGSDGGSGAGPDHGADRGTAAGGAG